MSVFERATLGYWRAFARKFDLPEDFAFKLAEEYNTRPPSYTWNDKTQSMFAEQFKINQGLVKDPWNYWKKFAQEHGLPREDFGQIMNEASPWIERAGWEPRSQRAFAMDYLERYNIADVPIYWVDFADTHGIPRTHAKELFRQSSAWQTDEGWGPESQMEFADNFRTFEMQEGNLIQAHREVLRDAPLAIHELLIP